MENKSTRIRIMDDKKDLYLFCDDSRKEYVIIDAKTITGGTSKAPKNDYWTFYPRTELTFEIDGQPKEVVASYVVFRKVENETYVKLIKSIYEGFYKWKQTNPDTNLDIYIHNHKFLFKSLDEEKMNRLIGDIGEMLFYIEAKKERSNFDFKWHDEDNDPFDFYYAKNSIIEVKTTASINDTIFNFSYNQLSNKDFARHYCFFFIHEKREGEMTEFMTLTNVLEQIHSTNIYLMKKVNFWKKEISKDPRFKEFEFVVDKYILTKLPHIKLEPIENPSIKGIKVKITTEGIEELENGTMNFKEFIESLDAGLD